MKVKTSITLSQEVLEAVDEFSEQYNKNRSQFIETAVQTFIAQLIQAEQNARDLQILNEQADRLNREAADVLSYQIEI